jgi:hypothetical protein
MWFVRASDSIRMDWDYLIRSIYKLAVIMTSKGENL